ncbi:hypothetical protein [Vulcanisaeta sp. JCM 14467]|uniref:hypothetical protein n=1 Tax=Vulcanisaeta sp. JCM 14467 TaxID=1295370 RepID=UPI0006D116BD|nr:hypothetical protein [Vulcanisaeta sp. JCM 14467]
MEFLTPLGSVNVGGRVLSNAKVSISDKYVFIIGVGPDGSYEERLLEINSDDARQIITNNKDYFNELLNKLDELIINIGREINVNISTKNIEPGIPFST